MAKGLHREADRIVLPNGLWLLLYRDGTVKLAGYDRHMQVTEVLNREGGAHVFVNVKTNDPTRFPRQRDSDLVTVRRSVFDTLQLGRLSTASDVADRTEAVEDDAELS